MSQEKKPEVVKGVDVVEVVEVVDEVVAGADVEPITIGEVTEVTGPDHDEEAGLPVVWGT